MERMQRIAEVVGWFVMMVCASLLFIYIALSTVNTTVVLVSSDIAICTYSGSGDYEQRCVKIEKE